MNREAEMEAARRWNADNEEALPKVEPPPGLTEDELPVEGKAETEGG